MKLENLSKLYDPEVLVKEERIAKRVSDSRGKVLKRTLSQKLMDTETTEEAAQVAVEALANEEPEVVLKAVVETLGNVVESLNNEVADSRKVIDGLKKMSKRINVKRACPKRKADAASKRAIASKIKDSESTEEAKEIALAALDEVDPESVVDVVIDVLAGVIDELENESVEQ